MVKPMVENSPNAVRDLTRCLISSISGTENAVFLNAEPTGALADVDQAIFVAIYQRPQEHAAH